MNIVGNGSRSDLLRWYQDVSDNTLPRAWVYPVQMFAYRIAMLTWALWISFALVGIFKWGWKNVTEPTNWHSIPAKPKKKKGNRISGDNSQPHNDPMKENEEK